MKFFHYTITTLFLILASPVLANNANSQPPRIILQNSTAGDAPMTLIYYMVKDQSGGVCWQGIYDQPYNTNFLLDNTNLLSGAPTDCLTTTSYEVDVAGTSQIYHTFSNQPAGTQCIATHVYNLFHFAQLNVTCIP